MLEDIRYLQDACPLFSMASQSRVEARFGLDHELAAVGVRSKMEKTIIITIASPQCKANLFIIRFILQVSALIKDDLHCKVLPPHAPGLLLVRVVQLLSGQDHPLVTAQKIAKWLHTHVVR